MKEIIKNLLVADKFNYIEKTCEINKSTYNKYSFIYAENNDKKMYYIMRFYKGIDDFNKRFEMDQNYSFDYICKKGNANEIKKNSSMIIFIVVDDIKEKNIIQSRILDIEEDIYFFKKYVLIYTNDEINDLKYKLKENNVKKFMEENINKEDLFQEFKLKNKLSAYSLILKLYIKLPHTRYNDTFSSDRIQNLNEIIQDEINERQLTEVHKEILEVNEQNIKEWIAEKINIDMESEYE